MWRAEKRAEREGIDAYPPSTFAKIDGALGVKTKRLHYDLEGVGGREERTR